MFYLIGRSYKKSDSQHDIDLEDSVFDPADDPMIDFEQNLFPYCITWTHLPGLSWCMPFVGHLGICDSQGRVHDFQGPYYVNPGKHDMAFGQPYKYWPLYPDKREKGAWDRALQKADGVYGETMHNICCNNCHHHVADALNAMQYGGHDRWTLLKVWWLMMLHSRYVTWSSWACTWGPFIAVLTVYIVWTLFAPGS